MHRQRMLLRSALSAASARDGRHALTQELENVPIPEEPGNRNAAHCLKPRPFIRSALDVVPVGIEIGDRKLPQPPLDPTPHGTAHFPEAGPFEAHVRKHVLEKPDEFLICHAQTISCAVAWRREVSATAPPPINAGPIA